MAVTALAGVAVALVAVGPQVVGRSDRRADTVADADLVAAAETYLAQADPSSQPAPQTSQPDAEAKRDRGGGGKAKGLGNRDASGKRLGRKDGVEGQGRERGPGHGHGLGLGRVKGLAGGRVTHGEFALRTKTGFVTAFVQQGEVTAAAATSVTVKSADGYTRTYAISSSTKVTPKPTAAGAAVAPTGSRARVIGTRDGDTFTVRRLHVRPAKSADDTD
jgi:hypothetical protein